VKIEGALILMSAWFVSVSHVEQQEYRVYFVQIRSSTLKGKSGDHDLFVTNPLTGTWKQLPPVLFAEDHYFVERRYLDAKVLTDISSGSYKVVAFYLQFGYHLVQIYDSTTGSWSGKMFPLEGIEILTHHAYLAGVFYRVVRNSTDRSRGLMAYNLETRSVKVLWMLPVDVPIKFGLIDLVVCGGMLILVAYNDFYTVERVTLLKIDLLSGSASEIARGPPAALNFGSFQKHPASDGDCIFFAFSKFEGSLAYNVLEDTWTSNPCPKSVVQSHFSHVWSTREYEWTSTSFQPGLNPFMAV
jgi:hypothetical protein